MRTPDLAAQLGGATAVRTVVDRFYDRVLGDPLLTDRFEHLDMSKQRRHLTQFLLALLAAPTVTAGETIRLRHAHARVPISNDDFDRTAGHLIDTLVECRVSPDLLDDVIARVAGLRPAIVNR